MTEAIPTNSDELEHHSAWHEAERRGRVATVEDARIVNALLLDGRMACEDCRVIFRPAHRRDGYGVATRCPDCAREERDRVHPAARRSRFAWWRAYAPSAPCLGCLLRLPSGTQPADLRTVPIVGRRAYCSSACRIMAARREQEGWTMVLAGAAGTLRIYAPQATTPSVETGVDPALAQWLRRRHPRWFPAPGSASPK